MYYRKLNSLIIVVITLSCYLLLGYRIHPKTADFLKRKSSYITLRNYQTQIQKDTILLKRNIYIEDYFQFMDSLVNQYCDTKSYPLTEHILVRANPWIIDTLANTDYYVRIAMDSFVYNQKKMVALPKGNNIVIPDSTIVKRISNSFQRTSIDINIPEYRLRIYTDTILLYSFPVRVGRNEKKYLEMSGRIHDLRTITGEGFIVKYNRYPRYINPVDNKEYFVTKRDDNRITKLPQIPFIETEINGLKNGQLIHPTTNQATLNKAYSNGCIGTKEADAWIIYYYAPIGTKLKIRYHLNPVTKQGDTLFLKDIYNRQKD